MRKNARDYAKYKIYETSKEKMAFRMQPLQDVKEAEKSMVTVSVCNFGSHTQHVCSEEHLPTNCVVDRMNATLLSNLALKIHLLGIHYCGMDNDKA